MFEISYCLSTVVCLLLLSSINEAVYQNPVSLPPFPINEDILRQIFPPVHGSTPDDWGCCRICSNSDDLKEKIEGRFDSNKGNQNQFPKPQVSCCSVCPLVPSSLEPIKSEAEQYLEMFLHPAHDQSVGASSASSSSPSASSSSTTSPASTTSTSFLQASISQVKEKDPYEKIRRTQTLSTKNLLRNLPLAFSKRAQLRLKIGPSDLPPCCPLCSLSKFSSKDDHFCCYYCMLLDNVSSSRHSSSKFKVSVAQQRQLNEERAQYVPHPRRNRFAS